MTADLVLTAESHETYYFLAALYLHGKRKTTGSPLKTKYKDVSYKGTCSKPA